MPKILLDVKERILVEARRQVLENGYSNMTIRSVAEKCDVSIGTIYNYFTSKDSMIATFMLEDWNSIYNEMIDFIEKEKEIKNIFHIIYKKLKQFSVFYAPLFEDKQAEVSYKNNTYHSILRKQIADLIFPCCEKKKNAQFLSIFLAENILLWTFSEYDEDTVVSTLLLYLK